MQNSQKHAWVWHIKPEHLEEYVAMHLNPWPEIMEEHRRAGIRNYSIFHSGSQFFYYFECDDVKKAFEYLDKSPDCQRWNAITSRMVAGSFDFGSKEPIHFLNRVFYLE